MQSIRKNNSMRSTLNAVSGITLIALVVTIVVLLILASVSITVVFGDNGILQLAKEAADKTNEAVKSDLQDIQNITTDINTLMNNWDISKVSAVTSADGKTVPVPKGFVGSNATGENTVIGGFVIYEGTMPVTDENVTEAREKRNQFVWIPVPELTAFAEYKTDANNIDKYNRINYIGVLYNWEGDPKGEKKIVWKDQNSGSYREPDNLVDPDSGDVTGGFNTIPDWNETLFQESFNKMVESVAKYKGFYIGRYETSLNEEIAQSKSGQNPMNNKTWYEMYVYSRNYLKNSTSIVSEMIWGCQWDAMLKFVLTGNGSSHINMVGNVGHDGEKPYQTGGIDYSTSYVGVEKTPYNDITANIYDLEGNLRERTQEAVYTNRRVYRGGSYQDGKSPSWRGPSGYGSPALEDYGSRLSIYIQ